LRDLLRIGQITHRDVATSVSRRWGLATVDHCGSNPVRGSRRCRCWRASWRQSTSSHVAPARITTPR